MPLLAHLGHQLFKSSHPPEVEGPDVLEKWALFESGGGFFGLFGGSKDKSKLITYKGKKTSKFIEFFEKDEKRLAYVHSHSKYVVEVRKETQKSLVQLKLASCEGQAVLAVRIKNSGTEMKCKINMQKVEKSGRRLFEFTGRSKSAKESSGGAEVEHYYFTLDSVDNKKETKDQKNLTDYKHSYQLEVGMPATKLGGSTIDFAYKYKFDLDLTNPFGMIINDPKEKSPLSKWIYAQLVVPKFCNRINSNIRRVTVFLLFCLLACKSAYAADKKSVNEFFDKRVPDEETILTPEEIVRAQLNVREKRQTPDTSAQKVDDSAMYNKSLFEGDIMNPGCRPKT
uniref:Uncharacterized protein n=1 Tax=Ditylenchus dipsaci TaxID=166011 RepID=A0A915CQK9_9BILA